MTAFAIDHRQGDLTQTAFELAPLSPSSVRIHVAAFGINRPDLLQKAGLYRAPADASPFLGLEVAGTIIEVGSEVDARLLGQKVCALTHGGGYASFVNAQADHCLPWPADFSAAEAACLPETLFTVWHNLIERGQLQAGDTALIQAGSSGIGTTAIQLAKALGATVISTAGTDDKCARLIELGADYALNYTASDYSEQLSALVKEHGLAVVLDLLGGEHYSQYIKLASDDARIVTIAVLTGAKAGISIAQVMLKRLTLTGSTLRAQSDLEKARIAQAIREDAWPLIQQGLFRPVMDSVFTGEPVKAVTDAHARMESRQHFGKIAVVLDAEQK